MRSGRYGHGRRPAPPVLGTRPTSGAVAGRSTIRCDGRPADRGRDRVRCALRLPGDDRRRLRRAPGRLRPRGAGRRGAGGRRRGHREAAAPLPGARPDQTPPSRARRRTRRRPPTRAARDRRRSRRGRAPPPPRPGGRAARGAAVQQGLRHLPRRRALGGRPDVRRPGGRATYLRAAVDARRRPRVGGLRRRRRPHRPAAPRRRREPAAGARLPRAGPHRARHEGARAVREPHPGERPRRPVPLDDGPGRDPAVALRLHAGDLPRGRAGLVGAGRGRRRQRGGLDDRRRPQRAGRSPARSLPDRHGGVAGVDGRQPPAHRGRAVGRPLARVRPGSRRPPRPARCHARRRAAGVSQPGRRPRDPRPGDRRRPGPGAGGRPGDRAHGVVRRGERRRGRHVVAERQPPAARRPSHVAVRRAGHRRRAPAARASRRRADVVLPRSGAGPRDGRARLPDRRRGGLPRAAGVRRRPRGARPAQRRDRRGGTGGGLDVGRPGLRARPLGVVRRARRTRRAVGGGRRERRHRGGRADRGAAAEPPHRRAARAHRLRRLLRRPARDRAGPEQRGVRGLRRRQRVRAGMGARRAARPRRAAGPPAGVGVLAVAGGSQRRHRGDRRARSQRQRAPGVLGRPHDRHVHRQPPRAAAADDLPPRVRPCRRAARAGLLPFRCARRPPRLRRAGRREPRRAQRPARAADRARGRPRRRRPRQLPRARPHPGRALHGRREPRRRRDLGRLGHGHHVLRRRRAARPDPHATRRPVDLPVARPGGHRRRADARQRPHAGAADRRPQRGDAVVARHRRGDPDGLQPGRTVDPRGGRPQLGRRQPRRRPGAHRAAAARR